jgi:hypothetical protein
MAMPKYFIDLRDGSGLVQDQEGSNFPNLEEALEEAKASARDLVRQYMDREISLTATCVEVRDALGRTIAAVTVAEVLGHPSNPHFKSECTDVPVKGGTYRSETP